MSCLIGLVNYARNNDKANFLLTYLTNIAFMVLPWVNNCQGLQVRFPHGRQDQIFVSPTGTIGLASFVMGVHRTIGQAWSADWALMYTAGHLSSPWQEQLSIVDVLIFVSLLERFRRSNQRPLLGNRSVELLSQLKDWMAVLLSHGMDQCLLAQRPQASQFTAPPARKFRTEDKSSN